MRRRLLNLLTVLSLLLCVAMAALWVRSYWVSDAFHWAALDRGRLETREYFIISDSGKLDAVRKRDSHHEFNIRFVADALSARGYYQINRARRVEFKMRPAPVVGKLGVGFQYDERAGSTGYWPHTYRQWDVRVPYWLLCVGTAVLPAFAIVRRTRQRIRAARRSRGLLCPSCGYDLRATPGRCPECGHGTPAAGAGT